VQNKTSHYSDTRQIFGISWDSLVGAVTRLGAGRSWVRIPAQAKAFPPNRPAFLPGREDNRHLHQVLRLRMSGAIPLLPLNAFTVCAGAQIYRLNIMIFWEVTLWILWRLVHRFRGNVQSPPSGYKLSSSKRMAVHRVKRRHTPEGFCTSVQNRVLHIQTLHSGPLRCQHILNMILDILLVR
jgi:hypothetical protein